MPADGAHQDISHQLRGIGWQPQGLTAISVWRRICEEDLPPAQQPCPRYCPRGAVVVAVEPFDGESPRVFEVLGSLRLLFLRATAVLGGARNADVNDDPRGGRLLVDGLPPQLLLLGDDQLRARGSHVR